MTSDNGSPPSESNPDSSLAANVRLGHEQGWSFTPLAGKRPTLEGWQKRPRETLEGALAWAAQGNVGLRTGQASGVVVIDVDPGGDVSGLDLPGTVTALTGRPGAYHLYYLCDRPLGAGCARRGRVGFPWLGPSRHGGAIHLGRGARTLERRGSPSAGACVREAHGPQEAQRQIQGPGLRGAP